MNLNPSMREESRGSLLPEDYVRAKSEHRANFIMVLMYSVTMFLVIAAFMITNRQWVQVRQEQRAVAAAFTEKQSQLQELEELSQRRTELNARAKVIRALKEPIPRAVLLSQLNGLNPGDIAFTKIELESRRLNAAPAASPLAGAGRVMSLGSRSTAQGNVNNRALTLPGDPAEPEVEAPRFEASLKIEGVSGTNTAIADYVAALRGSKLLRNVQLPFIEDTNHNGEALRKFQITAMLIPEDEMTQELLDQLTGREPEAEAPVDETGELVDGVLPEKGWDAVGEAVAGAAETGGER